MEKKVRSFVENTLKGRDYTINRVVLKDEGAKHANDSIEYTVDVNVYDENNRTLRMLFTVLCESNYIKITHVDFPMYGSGTAEKKINAILNGAMNDKNWV